jgi:hypothetical protein
MGQDGLIELLTTAGLAMLSVGLWTVRVAVTARGNRVLGASVAAVEATVFAVAFSRLLADLDSPERIAAYGLGVALGTLLGLRFDAVLNPRALRLVAVDPAGRLSTALSAAGWASTSTDGCSQSGPVSIVSLTIPEHELPALSAVMATTDSRTSWTLTPVARRSSHSGEGRGQYVAGGSLAGNESLPEPSITASDETPSTLPARASA